MDVDGHTILRPSGKILETSYGEERHLVPVQNNTMASRAEPRFPPANEATTSLRHSCNADSLLDPQKSAENAAPANDTLDPNFKKLADYLIQAMKEIKAEGANGWGEIAVALNHIDDDKIGHCKEDIDTLLVFAGLFSAVLTAFVVESYQSLSPDPTDQVIQLLAQIAIQTATPSSANGTVPITDTTQSFAPSTLAVYINRLWFISLVLSLITASFGILIKQWLREYKSVDSHFSNLRSRLRIRQFRYPGLIKWRVFELAAILPLLLQIALGLFLLGLCLFTSSIDASVGHATTVLVSAWIFFFLATTLAPTFSSSCPYKITFLAPILRSLRMQLNRFRCLKWLDVGPKIRKPQLPEVETVALIWTSVLLSYIPWIFSRFLMFVTNGSIGEWRPPLTVKEIDLRWEPRVASLEEKDIAADDQKDLELLSTVDDILSDDELLSSTMCSMIVRGHFKSTDIMAFVRKVLIHRLPQVEEYLTPGSSFIVDLRKLPSRVWEVVVDMTCTALQVHEHQRCNRDTQGFQDMVPTSVYHDALAILLSQVNDPVVARLDPSVFRMFAFYITQMPPISPGAFAHVSSIREILIHLRRFFPAGEFKKPTLIPYLHRAVYCQYHCHHSSLSHQFLAHRNVFDKPNQLLDMVYECLQESIDWEKTPSPELGELLCAVMLPEIFDNGDTRMAFAKRILTLLSHAPPAFIGHLLTAPL